MHSIQIYCSLISGRINVVDLAQIIGVDFSHVETKANEFVQCEPDVRTVLGQLISKY